jgi:DNA-binding CsgD family transcriptional regulator
MDSLLGTISAIYDAALDASGWDTALQKLCDLTDSVGFNVFVLDHQTSLVPMHTSIGIPEDILAGYSAHYATLDPGIAYFMKNPESEFHYNYQHTPEEEIDKNEYYSWLQQMGGTRYHLGKGFKLGSRFSCIVTAQRTRKIGHAQASDMELLGLIAPHLERAIRIDQHFKAIDLRAAAACDAMERLPYGIFFLCKAGAVLYSNELGRSIIARADGLSVNNRRIFALHSADDKKLQALIRDVIDSGQEGGLNSGGDLAVSRKEAATPYAVQAFPLASKVRLFTKDQPAAMIIVGDPDRKLRLKAQELTALYGLTATESRVALLLAKGLRPAQVCQIEHISPNTLKTHRKRIFAKMGIETQAQLSRVLNAV